MGNSSSTATDQGGQPHCTGSDQTDDVQLIDADSADDDVALLGSDQPGSSVPTRGTGRLRQNQGLHLLPAVPVHDPARDQGHLADAVVYAYDIDGELPPAQVSRIIDRDINGDEVEAYGLHFAFACFVTWCCCLFCGLLALSFACRANDQKVTQPQKARNDGRWSLALSSIGVVIGVIAIIIYFTVYYNGKSANPYESHYG